MVDHPATVVVATVRNRLQAELLTNEMRRQGIAAEAEEIGAGSRFGPRLSVIRVPRPDQVAAGEVVAGLTGRNAPLAMLDPRRLIPAILAIAALLALINWLVDLVV